MEEKQPEQVETQRAYDMIHRDAIAHIAAMKDRTWKITNYALLLFAALYFLTRTPFALTCWGKTILTIAAIGVAEMWLMVIVYATDSMKEKRERLNRLYGRFEKDAREVYGEVNRDRVSFWYDWPVTTGLFIVILCGMFVVIVNAWSGLLQLSGAR
ncbi:MAG: hypothetical protein U1E97_01740 [Alphaproteobacteria bacterium]